MRTFCIRSQNAREDKRSNVRLLARRRTGRKTPSAEPPLTKRPALYGSGLKGKKVKAEIARLAAEQSEAIYQAIVAHRQEGKDATSVLPPLGFDPTRPVSTDWQRVLEKVGKSLRGVPGKSAATAHHRLTQRSLEKQRRSMGRSKKKCIWR
jgi:hypothetical protein